jgi:hypothetical protein
MNLNCAGKIACLMLASLVAAGSLPAVLQAAQTQPGPDAKQQVLKLEDQWVEAELKHDAATLGRILDDKFLSTFGSHKPADKETFIKNMTSGDVDPTESQTLTERTVVLDGDTAVVVGIDTVRGTDNGAAHMAVYRYTVTYIFRNGRWTALAEHLAQVPKEK